MGAAIEKRDPCMVVVFLAPPNGGKGTLISQLVKQERFSHISTGNQMAKEIKAGTNLGREIKEVVESGRLVNDELSCQVAERAFRSVSTSRRWVLDGFPRTQAQARWLDEFLSNNCRQVDRVFRILVSDREVILRAKNRVVCAKCRSTYSVLVNALGTSCPNCGGEIVKRVDDGDEEVVRERLNMYRHNEVALLQHYSSLVDVINGQQLQAEVARDMFARLSELKRLNNM